MRRRGKGGGSVFYHEGKGKWVAQLTWIDPATGRKVKREKHCETRKEAVSSDASSWNFLQ